MPDRLLIDSDVAIDYLRGHPDSVAYIDNSLDELLLSAITVAELYAGYKGAQERQKLDAFVSAFQVRPLDQAAAKAGGEYRNKFGRSHGTDMNDAINAAIAQAHSARVVTLDVRHYPMLKDVIIPYRKP